MPKSKTDEGRLRRVLLLSLIRQHFAEHGYPPTLAELSRATNTPRTTLRWHLDSLREQGYLRFNPTDVSRTMKLTRKDKEMAEVQ